MEFADMNVSDRTCIYPHCRRKCLVFQQGIWDDDGFKDYSVETLSLI